jgi:tripartite-type tricarboxylate transporter receptor subunit TctC
MLRRMASGMVAISMVGAGMAHGQNFPNRIIRIIASAPGSGTDYVARQIAQAITVPLGQPVIVDNRSGIGNAETMAHATPDGYTMLLCGGSVWLGPLLQDMPYDVTRDFAPLSFVSRNIYIAALHPSVPATSIPELIALAKARPGVLNYGASTTGTSSHLNVELFKALAGVDIVRVSYKGTAAAVTGQLGGEVQFTIADAALVLPNSKSGRLRALAVSSAEPSALAPGLPTIAASGLPGYESVGMTVMFARANTPRPIITRLNQEIVRAVRQPELQARLLAYGEEVIASSPEQFAAALKSDIAKWSKLIMDAGIKTN